MATMASKGAVEAPPPPAPLAKLARSVVDEPRRSPAEREGPEDEEDCWTWEAEYRLFRGGTC